MTDRSLSRIEIARRRMPELTDGELVRSITSNVIATLGIEEPPVDMEMVASLLGIHKVVIDPVLPVSGCLLRRANGMFEIRVQGTEPATRQRFTVGHECGHTFFPGYATRPRYRCSPLDLQVDDPDVEALCDLAASELLLPSQLFDPQARQAPFDLVTLKSLAAAYGASLEATGRRLVDARPDPTALLVLTVPHEPCEPSTAEPKLRLDYAHHRGDWPYFLPAKPVTPGDPLDRASQGEIVSETCTITGICAQPVTAEVHAQSFPLVIDGVRQERVVALVRRPGRRP